MENKYLTVTALNRYLKAKLENDIHLSRIFICGELSNVKYHYNGHCYFTLKDETSRINAIMFKTQLNKVLFKLEDGMKVLAVAKLSVYEPYGTYQLYVEKLDMDGLGNLYMAYEKRRLLLEKEGLFSESHKKPIPKYATNIGIITASTGAAIHDIVRTIRLHCPSCKMTLYPTLVQGEEAAPMLVSRLLQADKNNHDVIIIGRGGGSLEDLWAFNDETLARTIYHASTPIISGVGHESDVTICDFVADLRAATPTAAANLAVLHQQEFLHTLKLTQLRMHKAITHKLQIEKQIIDAFKDYPILKNPQTIYQQELLHLDMMFDRLNQSMNKKVDMRLNKMDYLKSNLYNHIQLLCKTQTQSLTYQQKQLHKALYHKLYSKKQEMHTLISKLNAYSPLNTLERGYALVSQENSVITSKKSVNYSSPLTIRFSDGEILAYPKEEINHEENDV